MPTAEYRVDQAFKTFFRGRLRQVFFYITDRCQLRCEQCLYKTTLANRDMDETIAGKMLEIFAEYGAKKLTFIGGEPTLYDYKNGNAALFRVARQAKTKGFQYIRLDTNGLFSSKFLNDTRVNLFDNIAISFDGPDAASHDKMRGEGNFDRSLNNLKEAVKRGLYVTITVCVHPENVYRLIDTIELFNEAGVSEINFHPLFKMGVERDKFTGNTSIEPEEWYAAYEEITKAIKSGKWKAHVRVPERFVPTDTYNAAPARFSYCPVRMGERILVHPNGDLRICALCIGSEHVIGSYDSAGMRFNLAETSEIHPDRERGLNCLSQVKDFGNNVPLCISYKPNQTEYVWKTQSYDSVLSEERSIPEYMDDQTLSHFFSESKEMEKSDNSEKIDHIPRKRIVS